MIKETITFQFEDRAQQDAFHKRLRRRSGPDRVEELEIVIRAALSFVQGRHTDPNDGHAIMVIAAMRGALRRARD